MKTFDIITEADARVLERATTVELAHGGHITPLARDTLRERRITVVEEGRVSGDHPVLAPRADIRSLAIGSDDSGAELRRALVTFLRSDPYQAPCESSRTGTERDVETPRGVTGGGAPE
jgi:hypothetical protein